MRKTGVILSSLAALAMCPGWAQAAGLASAAPADSASPASATRADSADLPVRRVTLYTSGVGYFERTGSVDGDASETLLFPVGQVNDVLKSLILLDYGGGGIQPVTYGARDPLDKQLQAFSIDLSDSPSMAALLSRIRGATVTITPATAGAAALTGTVMGVETRTVTLPNNGGTTQEQFLNLLSDDGLHAVGLSDVAGLKIADPKLDSELRAALATIAEGRDTSKRPVRLAFHGQGKRNVLVGYLTEAPLWQTTYRLVLGEKPLLQGWALVQNTSQDDWSGVDLSLVSGRPISFTQDLYTPLYVSRPEIKPQLMASTGPVAYDSNLNETRHPVPMGTVASLPPSAGVPGSPAEKDMVASGNVFATDGNGPQPVLVAKAPQSSYTINGGGAFAPDHFRMSEASRAMGAQGALMGESLFSYHIKTPVSVPRQQSAMIPFVSAGITAEPVSIFNASVNETHPLTGTRIVNSTPFHLMGGPITVFDQSASANGYVGDALIDDTEPGQKRLISYAVDTAVDAVAEDNGEDNGQVESIKIAKGVITTSDRQRASTKYTFKNHAQKERLIVVESPYPGDGWNLLTPKKADEHTRDVDRFDVPVPAGESKTFVVTREMTQDENEGILDCDLPTLVQYSTNGKISADVKAALQEVIRRRQAVWHIDKEIANRRASADQISLGQQRIRDNMKALDHASTLYKRYVGELDAQETKLQSLQDQIVQLQADRDKAQTDLANYAGSLSAS